MAAWIFVLAAAIGAGEQGTGRERGFHEISREVSEALKRESAAKDVGARAAAVRAMCELHGEIVHDSRFATSDVLKEYRGLLWSRLTKIKAELKQQLRRGKSNKDKANRESLENLAALEGADSA